MRPAIEVRAAEPADLEALAELCLSARRESALGSQLCSADTDALRQQLGALAAGPGAVLLVAQADGAVAGFLLARVVEAGPFAEHASLAVDAVYVDPPHRRRGAGHALMSRAAELAAHAGATQVYAAPIPGARGMQRFFVQLGFAPAAAHRVTTTTALQRRLSAEGTAPRRSGPRSIEELIARRRLSRTEPRTPDKDGQREPDQSPRRSITMQVKRAVQTRREPESSTTIS